MGRRRPRKKKAVWALPADRKEQVRTPCIGVNPEWVRNGWDIKDWEQTVKVPIRKSEKVSKTNKIGVRTEERVYTEDKPFFWPRKVRRTTEFTHKGVPCGYKPPKKKDTKKKGA